LSSGLSNLKIAGVAVLLFFAVLLGVGIHHMISIGTCSSTGYSGDLGPVPYCPKGTGWWFLFLFAGIFGCLAGAGMAGSLAMVFGGIFGAIGVGSFTIILDKHTAGGSKAFGAIFGGCFAVVGIGAWAVIIKNALVVLKGASASGPSQFGGQPGGIVMARPAPTVPSRLGPRPTPPSAVPTHLTPPPPSAPAFESPFGEVAEQQDPIVAAYEAARASTPSPPPAAQTPIAQPPAPSAQPIIAANAQTLISGMKAIKQQIERDPAAEIAKLGELHAKGILTDAEFAAAKAKLLEQM
jgi:hypothetical protein